MEHYVHFDARTEARKGPYLPFDCPACGRYAVLGKTAELIHTGRAYRLIPIFRSRETTITCWHCGETLSVLCPLERLVRLPLSERGHVIRYRPSVAAQVLAVASLLLFLVPVVGLGLMIAARALTRGTRGWARAVSWVSLVLNATLVVVVVVMMLALEALGRA